MNAPLARSSRPHAEVVRPSERLVIGGGPPHTQTVAGTEQLNPDGTGTITYDQKIDNQQGPPLDITFIVSEKGNRIDGLVVDPGTVFSCGIKMR